MLMNNARVDRIYVSIVTHAADVLVQEADTLKEAIDLFNSIPEGSAAKVIVKPNGKKEEIIFRKG